MMQFGADAAVTELAGHIMKEHPARDCPWSVLRIGQGIHVKELTPKAGVKFLDESDQMVVSVAAPMSEAKLEALLNANRAAD